MKTLASEKAQKIRLQFVITVAVYTLCVGFLPVLVSGILEGNFWFNDRITLPYVAYTSVWFGDLVFLPLFNGLFFLALRESLRSQSVAPITGFHILVVLALSSLISLYANFGGHYFLWAADDIGGFLDTTSHQLTKAGVLHLIYSIVQLPVVFAYFWFRTKLLINESTRSLAKASGVIIFLFVLLPISDFLIRNLYVLGRPLSEAFVSDWQNLFIVPGTLLLLIITDARARWVRNHRREV